MKELKQIICYISHTRLAEAAPWRRVATGAASERTAEPRALTILLRVVAVVAAMAVSRGRRCEERMRKEGLMRG